MSISNRWVHPHTSVIFDGCYLCGGPVRAVLGSPGTIAPVCAEHARSVGLDNRTRATVAAQAEIAAREWHKRQTFLFDTNAFRVYGRGRGWWV